jgi:hypothetical protein
MGVVPPNSYNNIVESVVLPETEIAPPKLVPPPDTEKLEGLILVDAETGRPDVVVKQTNYTTWITAKKDYISRNDVREGYYRLPNLADVVGWMKTTISDASPQKAKWLFENFGVGPNNLMERAMELHLEELSPIYDVYDLLEA